MGRSRIGIGVETVYIRRFVMWLKDENDIPTGTERSERDRDDEKSPGGKDFETDPERRDGAKP